MDVFTVLGGRGRHAVEIAVALCGMDLSLAVCGGTHHHVGACALGIPRPSLQNPRKRSSSESVICVASHKDDVVAKSTAHTLAATFGCTVNVSAGLHLDAATQEDIDGLMEGYRQALDAVILALQQRHFGIAQNPLP